MSYIDLVNERMERLRQHYRANPIKPRAKAKPVKQSKTRKRKAKQAIESVRAILRTFWDRSESCGSPEQRAALLQEFACCRVVIPPKDRATRSEFDRKKERLLPRVWARPCWTCLKRKASHRHHIIELARGGLNITENLVPLCDICHAEVHPWMLDQLTVVKDEAADQVPPEDRAAADETTVNKRQDKAIKIGERGAECRARQSIAPLPLPGSPGAIAAELPIVSGETPRPKPRLRYG